MATMTEPVCVRCRVAFQDKPSDDWNVELRGGRPQWYLCPDCQTVGENTEALVNESTLEYRRDAFGRIVARPKGGASNVGPY